MKTFFHPAQLQHHPRTYLSRGQMRVPQEVPERALKLLEAVHALGWPVLEPADAGLAPVLAVHDAAYVEFLRSAHARWHEVGADWGDEVISNIFVRQPNARRGILAEAAFHLADGSCPVGEHSWRSAYWAAQSATAAAQAVLAGDAMAYALCRPPGHHARRDAAGGFCYLNNAAIAAQLLRTGHDRVSILDTDMHHGQGVQEIFYERADVQYVSVHGDPTNFYPGVADHADERGAGAGSGFNHNLPMPHRSSEADFFDHLAQALDSVRQFQPSALVLALGFDIYEHDPQSLVAVTSDGFHRLGQQVAALGLPTVVVQEGGYHLASLAHNARSFFSGLAP